MSLKTERYKTLLLDKKISMKLMKKTKQEFSLQRCSKVKQEQYCHEL